MESSCHKWKQNQGQKKGHLTWDLDFIIILTLSVHTCAHSTLGAAAQFSAIFSHSHSR